MSAASPTPQIRYEQPSAGVARIVLARPDKRNAQDRAMLHELDDAYRRAVGDESVRVIILAADGPDFSAGHDLRVDTAYDMTGVTPRTLTGGFTAPGAEGWYATEAELFLGLCLRWRDIPRPTIAAVHGRVIGGGLELIWPCDLIVAADDTVFHDPISAFGCAVAEYFVHPWELGHRRAKEMLFTGEPIDAFDAEALGMVNRVVPRADLESETLALAERIAARPSFGIRLAKRAVNNALDLQGQRAAVEWAFDAHHLAHSHNRELYDNLVDPAGADLIRAEARSGHTRPRPSYLTRSESSKEDAVERQFTTVVEGGDYFEGARWRDGRWYVSDALKGVVCAFDEAGRREDLMQVDALCSGLGWLPDGTLLVVSMKDRTLLARGADGAVRRHADLSALTPHWINDMYVDTRGRAWVGTIGFAIHEGETPRPGELFRVDPDGTVVVAARDLWCPNGVVVTADGTTLIVAESFAARLTAFTIGADGTLSDRRVFAQFGPAPDLAGPAEMIAATELAPDGMTIDSQDHVWVADANHQRCVRVSPAGEIVDEVAHPGGVNVYTCALGGSDGRQLLLAAADGFFEAIQGVGGTAALLATPVDVPA
ncbi:hypothetical protein MCHIJ_42380 [Mycolicibacterium chitae]|uniref:Enoyl-CoA hydratase/carnithine racemase n=1 Tax=Mycolicibacterium chitae TaxID=1792 RepID=A0A448I7C7_MYCCI|nr:enoyl-CoA hydratase [Mycolicibacterium chitae]MCV7109183.1 enoyl-CoA hydratase [Mycolicibacterium chitae]BBZ04801.1 hypothetical protein MCHIJ_42380 [Mycolicibacterium chitae]VEG48427.1 enoyl-CoA hydratase/carnithine racemase [Mycolicibacterium chitae]